eukprot:scaffold3463_cov266-Ochromonas_danica.AAC.4
MGKQEILLISKTRKATKHSLTPGIASKILFYFNDEFIFPEKDKLPEPLNDYLRKRKTSERKVKYWIKYWGPQGKDTYPPESPVVIREKGFLDSQTCKLICETAVPKLSRRPA